MPKGIHHRIIFFIFCSTWFFSTVDAQVGRGQNSVSLNTKLELPLEIRSYIDSLNNVLQTTPEGAQKITLCGKICWAYLGVPALDLAKLYADSVKLLAHKLNDSNGVIKAIYYNGMMTRLRGAIRTL